MFFIRAALRPGDTFLDVGANVGVYTLLAGSVLGPEGHIVAVEPDREARWQLLEHIAANHLEKAQVVPTAVGSASGWARMSEDHGPTKHVLEFVAQEPRPEGAGWVRVLTLDSICSDAAPFVAKMDIEGFELEALRGAEQLIARRRPAAWVLETNHCAQRYGGDEVTLESWVRDHGGALCCYDPKRSRLSPLTRDELEARENVIAVFDEDAIQERLKTPSGEAPADIGRYAFRPPRR